ncbi:PHP domain-containing protein [Lysinibacillus sphaericus]|uniref:PHP domain-containing protein n=1 Tax=Lysinibacillus sphaericus TaxID=1421 RepID=A0A544V0G8_LYSSH|nr:PHP domain-containing protein [Lysinibacillus sp. SDF0037]TQR39598.1 PHP domain-containing protein [Lysinibacillus sp. SDF0037]
MSVDLHMHTNCSDGELSPKELVQLIVQQGLRYFSISDHDTLAAYETVQQFVPSGVTCIPAMEFNTDGPNGELHILGYGLDVTYQPLQQYCDMRRNERWFWAEKIVEQLQSFGYAIDLKAVQRRAAGGIIVRTHIADELVAMGAFTTRELAFETVLKKGAPASIPRKGATSAEAIQMIHDAGGLAVLAHPGIYQFPFDIDTVVQEGIDGIEVYYALHSPAETEKWKQVAQHYSIYMTVGCDFHGHTSKNPQLPGTVPYQEEAVRQFLQEILTKKNGVLL